MPTTNTTGDTHGPVYSGDIGQVGNRDIRTKGGAYIEGDLIIIGGQQFTMPPDLDLLEYEYRQKMVKKHEQITMQGISPKVQNKTIGIRMADVFIPLHMVPDDNEQRVDWPLFLADLAESADPTGIANEWTTGLLSNRSSMQVHLFSEEQLENYARFTEENIRILQERYSVSADLLTVVDIIDLLDPPHAVVSGDPGSGKSTLTRYITWAICAGAAELIGSDPTAYLPVRIRAVEFAEALDRGSVDTLIDYLLKVIGNPYAPLLAHRLMTGQAFILIDGLDEISAPSLRERVKEQVDDFIADPHFKDNRLLITTRIVGYQRTGLTGRFPHFTLAELNDNQISSFVENWYRAIANEMPTAINVEQERQQLLDAVLGKPSIQRMARNPLLLTIIALIKWQGRTLPEQRVLLYDAAVQTLIRTWPVTQRKVELDELFIREWLAPVALHMLEKGESDLLDEYTLMELLVDTMKTLKSVTDFEAKRDSQTLLADIALHSGILLPRGSDEDGRELYGFLHQTMAEYLAAYYLAGRWEDGKLDLLDYAHVPYWREVLLLLAGHLGTQRRAKAGNFLQSILNLDASPYEPYIRRNLLLAAHILGDGVPVGPGDLVESILVELFTLWQETQIQVLRKEIEEIFTRLGNNEYAVVLARLVDKAHLTSSQVLKVATWFNGRLGIDFLLALLYDEDAHVRSQAVQALAEQDDPRGIDGLLALLQDEDVSLRFLAVEALAEQDDPRVIDGLLALLQDEDSRIRFWAVEALAKRDHPRGIDGLLALLQDEDASIQSQAATALAERDDPRVIDGLLTLLQDEDASIRYWAIGALAKRDDPRVIDGLLKLLQDKDFGVKFRAAVTLAEQDDLQGIDFLLALLQEEDAFQRSWVIKALAERDDPRVVDGLLTLLQDEDLSVRSRVIKALAERNDPRVVGGLLALLQDKDFRVRFWVIEALAERDDPRVVDGLLTLLQEEDARVRLMAAQALADRDDPRVVDGLLTLLQDENAHVRSQAAQALAEQDDQRVVDELLTLMQDEDARVRHMAVAALAEQDDPRGVDGLLTLLQDEDASIRYWAARILAKRDDSISISGLWRRMETLIVDIGDDPYHSGTIADIAYAFLKRRLGPRNEQT